MAGEPIEESMVSKVIHRRPRVAQEEKTMMALVSLLVFSGAMTASVAIIAAAVAPQWRRIVRLAAGNVEQPFTPLGHLRIAERRIAVRRWASEPIPASIDRLRAAA